MLLSSWWTNGGFHHWLYYIVIDSIYFFIIFLLSFFFVKVLVGTYVAVILGSRFKKVVLDKANLELTRLCDQHSSERVHFQFATTDNCVLYKETLHEEHGEQVTTYLRCHDIQAHIVVLRNNEEAEDTAPKKEMTWTPAQVVLRQSSDTIISTKNTREAFSTDRDCLIRS
jgi:hypothetical protein